MGKIPDSYQPGQPSGNTFDGQGTGFAIVQIIDACPSNSWQNTCKKFSFPGGAQNVSLEQRCGAMNTNALDVDLSAYQPLVGRAKGCMSYYSS